MQKEINKYKHKSDEQWNYSGCKYATTLIKTYINVHNYKLDFNDSTINIGMKCLRGRAVARGGVVVKALRYKSAGRGCHWNFSVT
jgi:hypothetical protein